MSCWEVLGLEPQADSRTVKRRYAQLLKVHRPDTDPQGFQRLREAYEHALREEAPPSGSPAPSAEAPVTPPAVPMPAEPGPVQRLVGQPAERLDQWLSEAEYRQQRSAFEQAVLAQCLAAGDDGRELLLWAIRRLGWFVSVDVRLSAGELEHLARRLAEQDARRLCARLQRKGARAFLKRLDRVLGQPWLQAFDQREFFQRDLFTRVLAMPEGAALFKPLCRRFGWSKADFPEGPQAWETLWRQSREQAFAARLQDWLRTTGVPRKAGARAARLLLSPMHEGERLRFTRHFRGKDWKACARLADQLTQHYPHVWARYGSPDVQAWQVLMPPREGWKHTTLLLWLLALTLLLPWGEYGAGGLDALLELLVLAFQGGIVALIVRGLMAAWSFLLRPLELYDLRLSRRVLGGARPGRRGLRLLRHGLGSALLALLFVLGSELPDGRSGLFGLALFGLFLIYAAVASRDPFFRGRQRSRTGASR